jgi:hypothetical protein
MIFDWFQHKHLYYEELFRKLYEKKIRYLVVGGIAVSLHGALRLTADADIMLSMTEENLKAFLAIMNELGYKPKVPVNPVDFADPRNRKKWMDEKGMKVFPFFHPDKPFELIDVFIDNPINFEEMEKNKVVKRLRGMEISIPSIKDLIELKRLAGREQDMLDIKNLEELEKLK